jgi:hypothetical protein
MSPEEKPRLELSVEVREEPIYADPSGLPPGIYRNHGTAEKPVLVRDRVLSENRDHDPG